MHLWQNVQQIIDIKKKKNPVIWTLLKIWMWKWFQCTTIWNCHTYCWKKQNNKNKNVNWRLCLIIGLLVFSTGSKSNISNPLMSASHSHAVNIQWHSVTLASVDILNSASLYCSLGSCLAPGCFGHTGTVILYEDKSSKRFHLPFRYTSILHVREKEPPTSKTTPFDSHLFWLTLTYSFTRFIKLLFCFCLSFWREAMKASSCRVVVTQRGHWLETSSTGKGYLELKFSSDLVYATNIYWINISQSTL